MKKFIYLRNAVLMLAVSLLIVSCSKQSPILNVIPKDAPLVITVNLNSIVQKGEMSEFVKSPMFLTIKKLSGKADTKQAKFIEEFFTDPSMAGVNFKDDIYMFLTKDGKYLCLAAIIDGADKTEAFVNRIAKDLEAPIKIKKDGEFTMIDDNVIAIGWSGDKFLLVADLKEAGGTNAKFKEFMALESDNCITANDDFKDFLGKKKDMNMWMDMAIVNMSPEAASMYKMAGMDFTGTTIHVFGEFAQGELAITGKMNMSEEYSKKFGNLMKDGLNPAMLNMLPKNKVLAAYGLAVKPDEYFNVIQEMLKTNPMFKMDQIDMMLQPVIGSKLKDVFSYFGGDFLISFNGLKTIQKEVIEFDYTTNDTLKRLETQMIPVLSIQATVKDDKLFKTLVEKIGPMIAKPRSSNYEFTIEGVVFYAGVQNNILVITNSEEIIDNAAKGFGNNSLASSEYAEMYKSSPAFFYANINYASYPSDFKDAINTDPKASGVLKMAMPYLEIYDAILFDTKKDNSISGSIKLKDKNVNFMKAVYDNMNLNIPKMAM